MKSFKTNPSNWIMGMYWVTMIAIAGMLFLIPFVAEMSYFEMVAFRSAFSFIALLFLFILYRAYTMKFTVTEKEVIVRGAFHTYAINRADIKSVEKVPIPLGFRLAGASLLGGFYYLPGIGKAWVAMNNFTDGVLIRTKNRNYLITPEKSEEFVKIF